jgi:hypothetical protein
MNMRYIIWGGLAVLLVVLLGRNPVAEHRDEENAWKKGKDPLMVSIQEHQKEKGKHIGGGGGIMGHYKNPTPYDNTTARKTYNAPPSGTYYNPNNPRDFNKQTKPNLQAPGNSYYPPPPENTGSPANHNLSPRSEDKRPLQLPDGRQVAFNGSQIFTFDSSGKRVTLEDGDYPLFDGRMVMYVRDGRRVAEPY